MKPFALISINPLEFVRFMDAVVPCRPTHKIVPYSRTEPPAFDPATHKLAPNRAVTVDSVVDGFVAVALTQEELDAIADQAAQQQETQQARQAYNALMNGTGTQAERLVRCERVLARVIKSLFTVP
jgi:hypothetical protein